MINIIKSDLYRIFRSKSIYVAFAAMLLLLGISIYMVQPGSIGGVSIGDTETYSTNHSIVDEMNYEEFVNLSTSELRKIMLKTEGYELDRNILAQNMNMYYIFIFVAALAIAVDFSTGSIKNTLSSAVSRSKYYISKCLFVVAACIIMFLLNNYIAYFADVIFNGSNLASDLETITKITLLQLPIVIAVASILVGIAFMAKKTSVFNTITIPLVIVFQLVLGVIVQLGVDESIADYELQLMFNRFANNPSDSYIMNSYILCAVLIVVFNLAGYLSFRKAEIK
jgi:ABC-type transport system involved in multi-copper enzyme maturation permease subunit